MGSLFFGVIIQLIAFFALLVGALFLIFRVVILWVLLIFSPLAWLSRAFGGGFGKLGKFWGEWWDEFFRWTFFAPSYAFFIYLATVTIGSGGFEDAFKEMQNISVKEGFVSGMLSNVKFLMQYIVVIIFLILGITSAQKLGGAAGGLAAGVAKKMQNKLQGWGKGKGITGKPVKWAYDKTAPAAVNKLGDVMNRFGFSKTGAKLQAKSFGMRQKIEETSEGKKMSSLMRNMSPAQLNEFIKIGGNKGYLAALTAKERGDLYKEKDAEIVKKAIGFLEQRGKIKEANELKNMRFDTLANKEEQAKAVRNLLESGDIKKVNEIVFKNNTDLAKNLSSELSSAEFVEMGKKLNKEARRSLTESISAAVGDDTTSQEAIKLRESYASISNNLTRAFSDQKGQINENLAKNYVKKMSPSQIGDIKPDDPDSLRIVGRFTNVQQLSSIRHELSSAQKEIIARQIKDTGSEELKSFIDNSLAWGGAIKKKEQEEQKQGNREAPFSTA